MKKISIIGNGFVGNAIYEGLKNHYNLVVYDKDPHRSLNSIEEVNSTDFVFLCVPTPMKTTGEFDFSIVKSAIELLEKEKVIIVKSTITPTAAKSIMKLFPNQNFVFNPEFLTERTAVEDFKNPSRIVLGGESQFVDQVKEIYLPVFPHVKFIQTDYQTACFIKYFCNCFYAAKVSLMNEFKQICTAEEANWKVALEGLLSSGWVNPMHTLVPGPDGEFGFGGKCFPKDMNAFINYSNSSGVSPIMLIAAWNKNLEVREDKNWLNIIGAVSNNNRRKK